MNQRMKLNFLSTSQFESFRIKYDLSQEKLGLEYVSKSIKLQLIVKSLNSNIIQLLQVKIENLVVHEKLK